MKKVLVILLVLALHPAMAFAAKIVNLYEVETSVSTQASAERAEAVAQGLLQVLMKVSGDPTIANNPVVRASLSRADYYVQDFSYISPEDSSQYILKIHYEKNDVNRLLKKAGIAYWGEYRPLMLVWLAFTNAQHETEIIGSESSIGILDVMKQQAKRYGLPIIFPLMDMNDVSQVTTRDVISGALPILREAGRRYAPDAILIGRIQSDKNGFKSEWQLALNDNHWSWSIADKSTGNIIAALLNQISQTFAKQYMLKVSHTSSLWLNLQVSNILQRTDLADLMDYLKQLPIVQQVKVAQVSPNAVQLAVQVRGPLTAFRQHAGIGERFTLVSEDTTANKLNYEWKR